MNEFFFAIIARTSVWEAHKSVQCRFLACSMVDRKGRSKGKYRHVNVWNLSVRKFPLAMVIVLARNIQLVECMYTPKEIWIGGLFPSYRKIGPLTSLDKGGVMRKMAFVLAIDEINNSTTVLPNTTLKFGIGDSRRSSTHAIQEASRVVAEIRKKTGNFPAAIIGPASSGPTQMVCHLCNGLVIPEIGYSATSPSLSDDTTFRYFARLPPSDAFQVVVMAHLLNKVLKVHSFVALSGPGLYSTSGIDALIEVAAGSEYQMATFKRYTLSENTDLIAILREIKEDNCNAIAVFAQSADYKAIFEAAAEVGIHDHNKFVWVVSETFVGYVTQYKVSAKVGNILDGVFVAEMENGKTLASSQSRYPKFAKLWHNKRKTGDAGASIRECSTRKDGVGEYIWLHDHDLNLSTPPVCSGFDGKTTPLNESTYASFSYDAAWTAALAMHKLIEVDKKVNGSSVNFPNEVDRKNLYNIMLGSQFKGATGDVQFSPTGDRNTASVTYNILQGAYANGNSVTLENVGTFYQGKFTPVAKNIINENFDFVCTAKPFESNASQSASDNFALILQFTLSLVFLLVSFLVALAYINRFHKQRQDRLNMRRMSSRAQAKKKTISLKQSLKRKLIQELSVNATVLMIEFFDLGTDWYAYQENNFRDQIVLSSTYYFFMLTGSACSLVAIFYRVQMSREVLKHYRDGIEVVDHGIETGDGENIIDKIDPPGYLLSKYTRFKRQAFITTLVGIVEDIPQFGFNIAKGNSTTATMLAITFSAISLGYKVSMPILWQQLGIILEKQDKQLKLVDNAHSMLAAKQKTELTPLKLAEIKDKYTAKNPVKNKYVVEATDEMADPAAQTAARAGSTMLTPSNWNAAAKLQPLEANTKVHEQNQ